MLSYFYILCQVAQGFYSAYFLSLLQDVLYVLTDRLHKPNLTMHAKVLSTMFQMVEGSHVVAPLWESAPGGAVVGADDEKKGPVLSKPASAPREKDKPDRPSGGEGTTSRLLDMKRRRKKK